MGDVTPKPPADELEVTGPGTLRLVSEHLGASFHVRVQDIVGLKSVGSATTYLTRREPARNLFIGKPIEVVQRLIDEAKKKEAGPASPTPQLSLAACEGSEEDDG